jgi:hypothetical protein
MFAAQIAIEFVTAALDGTGEVVALVEGFNPVGLVSGGWRLVL